MPKAALARLWNDYGTILGLLALCVFFSVATLADQHPEGAAGAETAARDIASSAQPGATVFIIARDSRDDREFADRLTARLTATGFRVVGSALGQPGDARRALDEASRRGERPNVIAVSRAAASWPIFENFATRFPDLASASIATPRGYRWPNFLKTENLLNIANQISVIAIIAVGMTLVIIAGGIDLSVGSLAALSAVSAALLIRDAAGATEARTLGMTLSSLGAIALCGAVGSFSGAMVAFCGIPPFIVTLAMMLVASGLAFIIASGQSIYQLPESFVWLGRGADLAGLPNALVLMLALYAIAHLVMTRTALGRHIYAVGGNPRAARLAGVPVARTLIIVYAACGALAGLGGVIMASQLKSGAPTYGQMYELYAIAAVVVGGTSLSGGAGRVLGTLIGAFIIAVIQNGMNLTNVESYRQKVVLGLVILAGVLLDQLKKRGWKLFSQGAFDR